MSGKRFLYFILLLLFPFKLNAQESEFGDITLSELQTVPLIFEKGAEGTVLSDITNAAIIYANGFKIEYTRTVSIKIFKSSGYYLANVQIPFSNKDKLTDLKAAVFNIADNLPERTDIPARAMFREKVDPYHNMIRFTFPNVREGSIIQYSYSIIQNEIWNYHSTRFQREIPVRFVKYVFSHPEYLNYVIHYNQDSLIQFGNTVKKDFFNGNLVNFNEYSWIGSNLGVFENEPMMPGGDQFVLGVDFALVSVNLSDGMSLVESPSYESLTNELILNNAVGEQLNNTMLFSGVVRKITEKQQDKLQKMSAVYSWVQKEMKWNGYEQMWPARSLIKARNDGTGTNAEINLILVNMLRTAGIQADPVILSTRDNGPVNQVLATTGRLNYLVACAVIDDHTYLMDASDKYNPAGTLPFKCMNGNGWVLNPHNSRWIPLYTQERFAVNEAYDLILDENKKLSGKAIIKFDGFDASKMRRLISEEGVAGFIDQISSMEQVETVNNLRFINLDSLQLPLEVHFDAEFNLIESARELEFFRPVISLYGSFMNNWIGERRLFPVDMGCGLANNYYCKIKIPENLHVEDIPTVIRIKMPENDGIFTFSGGVDDNNIVIVSDLKIKKVFYDTNDYDSLREFFAQINQKCRELVILHKVP